MKARPTLSRLFLATSFLGLPSALCSGQNQPNTPYVKPNQPVRPGPVLPRAPLAPPAKPIAAPLPADATTKPATGTAVDAPPMTELQNELDQKQYPAAVKTASKLLAMRGPAAAGFSRFQVTMLKGEAQVGMKSMSAAAATFKSALKETKDPHELALATWTGELFARAKGTTYVPKTIGAGTDKTGPIDLMDHDRRKDAFAAMLDDDLSALSPKLKAAVVSQNLTQIWPVLEQVVGLDQLDVIAYGNDDKTTQVSNSLLDHSRNLLTNALKGMWSRVDDIDKHANYVTNTPSTVVINGQYVTQNISKKNGLSGQNRRDLGDDITTCQKIHDAAEVFMPLAKSDKDWGAILNDADRVAGRASDVLNADYGSAVSDLGGTSVNTGLNGQFNQTTPTFPGGGTGLPIPRPHAPPKPTKPDPTGTGTKSN